MRVKRYIVDTMPDALQKIRRELGKDAVVLNTKEGPTGGRFELFGKKRIEVIAATEDQSPSVRPPRADLRAPYAVPDAVKPAAAAAEEAKPYAAVSNEAKPYYAAASNEAKPSAPPEPAPPFTPSTAVAAADPKFMQFSSASAGDRQLLEEIRQMKDMLHRLSRQPQMSAPLPEPFALLEERLLEQEVEPELARALITRSLENGGETAASNFSAARERLKEEIRSLISPGRVETVRPESRVIHLVGPTGVGKTTTIAKLAAEQVLKHRRKVGFITSDTYRIAAVEQLRTYANILNVPMEVVFSHHELQRAFRQLADCDIIFMDTAGRNYRNEMYVSELNSLLTGGDNSETCLVLSMTMRYKDMRDIVERFSRFKVDKLLFTKQDETETYGTVLNLLYEFPLKLSYVANGQNVPDDIAPFDVESWLNLLLKEDRA